MLIGFWQFIAPAGNKRQGHRFLFDSVDGYSRLKHQQTGGLSLNQRRYLIYGNGRPQASLESMEIEGGNLC